jgi:hypothetical protein
MPKSGLVGSHNTLLLDVAVLTQDYSSPIAIVCGDSHITELDEILITPEIFKTIFFPHGENFCITKVTNPEFYKYITFLPPWRSVCLGQPFSLLEVVISNIETDLGVTRNCFETCTLIELSKEFSNIKTLCDIKFCSNACTLTWGNILNIIRTEAINSDKLNPLTQIILVINVVFQTSNPNILLTIVKFKYRMDVSKLIEKEKFWGNDIKLQST